MAAKAAQDAAVAKAEVAEQEAEREIELANEADEEKQRILEDKVRLEHPLGSIVAEITCNPGRDAVVVFFGGHSQPTSVQHPLSLQLEVGFLLAHACSSLRCSWAKCVGA